MNRKGSVEKPTKVREHRRAKRQNKRIKYYSLFLNLGEEKETLQIIKARSLTEANQIAQAAYEDKVIRSCIRFQPDHFEWALGWDDYISDPLN